jgi:hypothetical protein
MCPPEKERTEEQKKQAKIVEQNISVGNLTIKKKKLKIISCSTSMRETCYLERLKAISVPEHEKPGS